MHSWSRLDYPFIMRHKTLVYWTSVSQNAIGASITFHVEGEGIDIKHMNCHSQICSLCSDLDFDVLELFVDGHNALFFYNVQEWEAAVSYCVICGFEICKYISL